MAASLVALGTIPSPSSFPPAESSAQSERNESRGLLKPHTTSVCDLVMYYVYIARTGDNRLYIGHTGHLNRRIGEHARGKFGAKFLKDHGKAFQVVHTEAFQSRVAAMKRERQLKRWSRSKKEALAREDIEALERL